MKPRLLRTACLIGQLQDDRQYGFADTVCLVRPTKLHGLSSGYLPYLLHLANNFNLHTSWLYQYLR